MPNGEAPKRSQGSLLPASLYESLGVKVSITGMADALVAVALEEHIVWAGIRLRRERAAQDIGSMYRDRTFITDDRLDADLAPRNELVKHIGDLLEVPNQMAEVATTMLEIEIDAHVRRGDGRFAVPGLEIRGELPNRDEWRIYDSWLSMYNQFSYEASARFGRGRRLSRKRPDWTSVIVDRPPLPYRVQLRVASDLPSGAESVPWTEVSVESPPAAGTATLATE